MRSSLLRFRPLAALLALLALSVAPLACSTPLAEGAAGSNEGALTDFAGQAGIVAGSAEAAGVLALANDARLAKTTTSRASGWRTPPQTPSCTDARMRRSPSSTHSRARTR